MKIIFARHGESQANLSNTISNRILPHGLTPDGRKQATTLAKRLKHYSITKIFTSPVPRAVETASILARSMGLDYEIADALREHDCGILEGRSDEAAWKQWREIFDAWFLHTRDEERLEGGESYQDLRQRFISFIDGLVQCYGNTQAAFLLISHRGIYSLMLSLVMQNVNLAMMKKYGFDYVSYIVAELTERGLVCIEWNGHPIHDHDR